MEKIVWLVSLPPPDVLQAGCRGILLRLQFGAFARVNWREGLCSGTWLCHVPNRILRCERGRVAAWAVRVGLRRMCVCAPERPEFWRCVLPWSS